MKRWFGMWMVFVLTSTGCSGELLVDGQKHQSIGQYVTQLAKQDENSLAQQMKNMKVSQRQWIRSAQVAVMSCAKEKFVPTWDLPVHPQTQHITTDRWHMWKHQCADQIVSHALLYNDADRAYAMATAIRHFLPDWSTVIIPSYVSVP